MSKPLPARIQFYRFELPETCIPFSSNEGKEIFKESMNSGYANMFFSLSEQFKTQPELSYCGLTSLVIALNVLQIDPKRIWKGCWRWYHEDMLDCCLSLDLVQQKGITFEQFANVAACNNLDANVVRIGHGNATVEDFRDLVKEICMGSGRVLISHYGRNGLKQPGIGHFSPLGAYNIARDLVLIMDVSRYKYPPHWVKVTELWEAMSLPDDHNLPRGYVALERSKDFPLTLFRLSTTFRLTLSSRSPIYKRMASFLTSWTDTIKEVENCSNQCHKFELIKDHLLEVLTTTLSTLSEGECFLTTQFDASSITILPEEHKQNVLEILKAIEDTDIFKYTKSWILDMYQNNKRNFSKLDEREDNDPICKRGKNCCTLRRIGKVKPDVNEDVCDSKIESKPEKNDIVHGNGIEHRGIFESHFITMLFLSWPYNYALSKEELTGRGCLSKHIEKTVKNSCDILQNEVRCLQLQIQSLLSILEPTTTNS